jgi:hypothetical protein
MIREGGRHRNSKIRYLLFSVFSVVKLDIQTKYISLAVQGHALHF